MFTCRGNIKNNKFLTAKLFARHLTQSSIETSHGCTWRRIPLHVRAPSRGGGGSGSLSFNLKLEISFKIPSENEKWGE